MTEKTAHDRVKELLGHNSRQLEENRAQRAVIRHLTGVIRTNQEWVDPDSGKELFDTNADAIKQGEAASVSKLHTPEKQS